MNATAPRYGQIDRAYGMRLATTPPDEDGPVWMVNLMKYRDVAEYADGRGTVISGREADDLSAPLGPLAAVGADVVFFGDVARQLLGETPAFHDAAAAHETPSSMEARTNAAAKVAVGHGVRLAG